MLQVPGLVVMEVASADAADDGGGHAGVCDPAFRRLLCVVNAQRVSATADWPSGAAALSLHPLQARGGRHR